MVSPFKASLLLISLLFSCYKNNKESTHLNAREGPTNGDVTQLNQSSHVDPRNFDSPSIMVEEVTTLKNPKAQVLTSLEMDLGEPEADYMLLKACPTSIEDPEEFEKEKKSDYCTKGQILAVDTCATCPGFQANGRLPGLAVGHWNISASACAFAKRSLTTTLCGPSSTGYFVQGASHNEIPKLQRKQIEAIGKFFDLSQGMTEALSEYRSSVELCTEEKYQQFKIIPSDYITSYLNMTEFLKAMSLKDSEMALVEIDGEIVPIIDGIALNAEVIPDLETALKDYQAQKLEAENSGVKVGEKAPDLAENTTSTETGTSLTDDTADTTPITEDDVDGDGISNEEEQAEHSQETGEAIGLTGLLGVGVTGGLALAGGGAVLVYKGTQASKNLPLAQKEILTKVESLYDKVKKIGLKGKTKSKAKKSFSKQDLVDIFEMGAKGDKDIFSASVKEKYKLKEKDIDYLWKKIDPFMKKLDKKLPINLNDLLRGNAVPTPKKNIALKGVTTALEKIDTKLGRTSIAQKYKRATAAGMIGIIASGATFGALFGSQADEELVDSVEEAMVAYAGSGYALVASDCKTMVTAVSKVMKTMEEVIFQRSILDALTGQMMALEIEVKRRLENP